MNKETTFFITNATMIIAVLILPAYIYLYKNGLDFFWILFIVERVVSPVLESKFESFLDKVDIICNESKEESLIGKILLILLVICLIAIGILIYILIKYTRLFVIIMIGELIDKIIKKIICTLKR